MTTSENRASPIRFLRFCTVGTILAIASWGCVQSPDGYVDELNLFVNSCEQHQYSYTEAEWKTNDARFEDFSEKGLEAARPHLSDLQRTKVNKLLGRYRAIRIKSSLRNWANKATDYIQQAGTMVNELTNDTIQPK